jgi:hypothetical protein
MSLFKLKRWRLLRPEVTFRATSVSLKEQQPTTMARRYANSDPAGKPVRKPRRIRRRAEALARQVQLPLDVEALVEMTRETLSSFATEMGLLAESVVAVAPGFDADRFRRRALRGLAGLGLMQRGAHVARALAGELPAEFDEAAKVLVASFGPELSATEGNGLAPFFYLPHSCFIASRGVSCRARGLGACYELTKRFTAEFCIRPFLAAQPAETLQVLEAWTADPNPHVRRLVSEGTRPRLPWGMRLRAFQDDPITWRISSRTIPPSRMRRASDGCTTRPSATLRPCTQERGTGSRGMHCGCRPGRGMRGPRGFAAARLAGDELAAGKRPPAYASSSLMTRAGSTPVNR